MTISFNEIPQNIRVPFTYIEFDNSNAVQGLSSMAFKVLAFGQKTSTGTANALTPTRITSAEQARTLFGSGSQLEMMLASLKMADSTTEVIAIALDDATAGSSASATLTITGTATSGTINLYIAPFYEGSTLRGNVRVAVRTGMKNNDIATALATAINSNAKLPVTAVAQENVLTLTAKNKGLVGNDIAVLLNYFDGEHTPENLKLTLTGTTLTGSPSPTYCWAGSVAGTVAFYGNIDPARPFQTLPLKGLLAPKKVEGVFLAGGEANPDVSNLLATLGDEHYNILACPYTDTANLTSLKIELAERRSAMRQIDSIAFCASKGTHSELATLGNSHNSQDLCILGTGGNFTMQEKNLLLFDGIATYSTTADGGIAIQRLITTYKTSPNGAEDISYLDVNTLLTLSYLRFDFRNYILRKYPRHKLGNDGTRYGMGQAIITPKVGKAEAIARFRMWEEQGLVENAEAFKEGLICERNPKDPNRLDWYLPPNLINQFRVGGVQIGFVL